MNSLFTVPDQSTAQDMRAAFIARYGESLSWRLTVRGSMPSDACISFVYWQGTNVPNTAISVVPGAVCGTAPPLNRRCDISTESILINHGTLYTEEVNGARSKAKLTLNCNGTTAMDVRLSLFEGEIALGSGLISKLYIDNQELTQTGLTYSVTRIRELELESVLRTTGTVPTGALSGSSVLLLSYP